MKVYISPSSQSGNSYAIPDYVEAGVCYEIGKLVKQLLEKEGVQCEMPESQSTTIQHRALASNKFGADVHLCIHTNAGGGDGTVVFCYPKNVDNELVKSVYNEVAVLSPGADDGIRPRTDLYEINNTKALCIYVEVEFHDREDLASWIVSHTFDIAAAIVRGLLQRGITYFPVNERFLVGVYLGDYEKAGYWVNDMIEGGMDATLKKVDESYLCQVGSFSDFENAYKFFLGIQGEFGRAIMVSE